MNRGRLLNNSYRIKLFGIFLIFTLSGCQSNTVTPPPTITNHNNVVTAPYPTVSDLPTPILEITGKNFKINQPLASGTTEISGEGPKGLTVIIVDVTQMGKLLATVRIDGEGTFNVVTSAPLEANHVIGIQLPDNTRIRSDALAKLQQLGGERYRIYPQVGTLYDSVIVR